MSELTADLSRAEELAAAGELGDGRAVAEAVLARDPEQPRAHNVLGFVAHAEGRLEDAVCAFTLACTMPGADDDMHENLLAVLRDVDEAAQAQEFEADIARTSAPQPAPVPDFTGTFEDLHAGRFGQVMSARLLGATLGSDLDQNTAARFTYLASATSMRERAFLLRFAARFWDGEQDVFENGPLLGGTTRALALGMLANPKRKRGALLHTHDWFSSRVELDLHPTTFPRMIEGGAISQAQYDDMMASGSFQRLYEHLHARQDYSHLVRAHEAYLPGHRGDTPAHGEVIYAPPPDSTFNLVFVDGCKSWYGTKHWIEHTCSQIPVGSHLIFQDYGWFTCFWLPALVGVLPDHFRVVAHVDDTYAFELLQPITPADIDARFPDTPEEFGREAFAELFGHLLTEAGLRSDGHSIIALSIQHAGALATIGFKDEARARIQGLLERPEHLWYAPYIKRALLSPTYTPEGPVEL